MLCLLCPSQSLACWQDISAACQLQVVLVGPHAGSSEHLLGNYYDAVAGSIVTPLQAFQVDSLIVVLRLPNCTTEALICMQ